MLAIIREAFLEVYDGYSSDRVIADPELNNIFLTTCHNKGLNNRGEEINRRLLNVRKSGSFSDIKTTRKSLFRNQSDYSFASEIAIRFLERRDGVTLDQVICSPKRSLEFDEIADKICPGYTPLQYRWAALYLRKKRKLKPETLSHVCRPLDVIISKAEMVNSIDIPIKQGLYIFFDSNKVLYVGESINLRNRLKKHLDHSDNKGLAHWIWDHGEDDLNIEIQILPADTTTRVRKAMEYELITSRNPLFNIKGT